MDGIYGDGGRDRRRHGVVSLGNGESVATGTRPEGDTPAIPALSE